ncbi:MAG: UDP-N-acetylmuramoyl-tripeptide--D-alanyl-D-alanine ligase [Bacteroidetes bacterium]|nr:UDP-N-acetylmuramoyl-tripeptide--D-alanyl-D-alanine ligase [Bacteroidota bacterium]
MTTSQLYDIYLRHPSVVTDTRQLKEGDLFFALKGPNFNGNKFALRALESGAAYAVIDESPEGDFDAAASLTGRLILVPDVLRALQDLALHHRKQFNIPFIAITGSNGKTTTKELVHAVLSSTYLTYTTKGNLNNHIGIPLTILSVRPDAEFAVIEMGANHQKEIEGYCRYTLPTHGIITNIGKAHLEGFGGPEGVKKGKGELYDWLRDNGGTAFVLIDSTDLRQMSRGIAHVVTYGTTSDADYAGKVSKGEDADTLLNVEIVQGAVPGIIHTQLVGDYNLPNILVAVTVGKHFGVPDPKIYKAIEQYTPSNSRSQLLHNNGNHIILDAYNANPSSMRAAIENFARVPGDFDKKVLILGAMAELGPESIHEHQAIVSLISQYPWRDVALVGGDFQKIDHGYRRFADSKEAGHWLSSAGFQDTYMLIKGSRSSRMELVLG